MAQILNFKGQYDGLTDSQAEERLVMYGRNDDLIGYESRYSVKKSILNPRSFSMLIGTALLFAAKELVMGAVMLLLTVFLTVGDVLWQIRLYEKELNMKKLSGMKCRAVRNGELTLVRKEYIVPDDIIVLQSGERVPADAHILEERELTVDESLFTADPTPVIKRNGAESGKTLPKATCVYKNTVILSGTMIGRVFATGEDVAVKREESGSATQFERALKKPFFLMTMAGIIAAVLTAIFSILSLGELPEGSDRVYEIISRAILPAFAVGSCFIPCSADKLVKSFYLNGAQRLSRRHALVKNTRTVEQLSAITCVCVEKSGTITKNQMEVTDVSSDSGFITNVAVLACEPAPALAEEKAILLYAAFQGADVKSLFSEKRIASYPFSENTKMSGNLWEINGQRLMCVKGGADEILSLCNVDENELHFIEQKRRSYAKQGRQVLAAAFAALSGDAPVPESISALRYEYIGLIALENPTRDTVPYAVKSCLKAGVRVIMITGDSEDTAAAVGKQVGLHSARTASGADIEALTPEELAETGIFARMIPAQKMTLLKRLRENGEIVAVVGGAADDIRFLEEADVGISVSGISTAAAEESCDMLMSDDNFLAVADAVKECRQIHRNIKSALALMLSAYFTLAVFAVVLIVTGAAAVFNPILSALLSLTLFPAAASMLIGNTADLRSDFNSSGFIGKGVINNRFYPKVIILGCSLGLALTVFYLFSMNLDHGVRRSLLLLTMSVGLVLESLSLCSVKRTFISVIREKQSSGLLTAGIIILCSLILIFIPYLNGAFGFASVDFLVLLPALGLTALFTLWREVAKKINSLQN